MLQMGQLVLGSQPHCCIHCWSQKYVSKRRSGAKRTKRTKKIIVKSHTPGFWTAFWKYRVHCCFWLLYCCSAFNDTYPLDYSPWFNMLTLARAFLCRHMTTRGSLDCTSDWCHLWRNKRSTILSFISFIRHYVGCTLQKAEDFILRFYPCCTVWTLEFSPRSVCHLQFSESKL